MMTSKQVFSNSGKQFWHLWIVALVWNAFMAFTIIKGGQGILDAFAANPVLYFILSFPLIGLWIIFQAIRH